MNISEIQRVNDAINYYTEKSEEYKNKARTIAKGCIWFDCGHFIPESEKENLETVSETTTQPEVVFRDCGYGDDDRIADITRFTTFYICPLCGTKKRKNTVIIRQVNERRIGEWKTS
jgi:hypothetical protein